MEHYEVAQLEENFVQQIQQFEKKLESVTGQKVALVAFAADERQSAEERD